MVQEKTRPRGNPAWVKGMKSPAQVAKEHRESQDVAKFDHLDQKTTEIIKHLEDQEIQGETITPLVIKDFRFLAERIRKSALKITQDDTNSLAKLCESWAVMVRSMAPILAPSGGSGMRIGKLGIAVASQPIPEKPVTIDTPAITVPTQDTPAPTIEPVDPVIPVEPAPQ